MSKKPLAVIFLTVFIDLVGFGIIIPLNPYLAREFGATPLHVGLLMAIYSALQFLFSPFWGQVSDRIGRRPVLLLSLFGTSLAHAFFFTSTSLLGLFVARALAGFFSANISTAMAYIADVSENKDRSKSMGLIGAAFGLGFVLGPALGGVVAHWGESLPALAASAICMANFIFAVFVLRESLPPEKRSLQVRKSRIKSILEKVRRPVAGPLLLAYFSYSFAMANMEASLFLLVKDRFLLSMAQASYGFAYVGVCMAITQGLLIRRLLPVWGERGLLFSGFILFTVAMFLTAVSPNLWVLALAMTVMAVGGGFINPSVHGTLSNLAGPHEQGEVLGVSQSLAALARIIGPPVGGFLYMSLAFSAPFVFAGLTALVGFFVITKIRGKIPQTAVEAKPL